MSRAFVHMQLFLLSVQHSPSTLILQTLANIGTVTIPIRLLVEHYRIGYVKLGGYVYSLHKQF